MRVFAQDKEGGDGQAEEDRLRFHAPKLGMDTKLEY
jgi:hypothetical protein